MSRSPPTTPPAAELAVVVNGYRRRADQLSLASSDIDTITVGSSSTGQVGQLPGCASRWCSTTPARWPTTARWPRSRRATKSLLTQFRAPPAPMATSMSRSFRSCKDVNVGAAQLQRELDRLDRLGGRTALYLRSTSRATGSSIGPAITRARSAPASYGFTCTTGPANGTFDDHRPFRRAAAIAGYIYPEQRQRQQALAARPASTTTAATTACRRPPRRLHGGQGWGASCGGRSNCYLHRHRQQAYARKHDDDRRATSTHTWIAQRRTAPGTAASSIAAIQAGLTRRATTTPTSSRRPPPSRRRCTPPSNTAPAHKP